MSELPGIGDQNPASRLPYDHSMRSHVPQPQSGEHHSANSSHDFPDVSMQESEADLGLKPKGRVPGTGADKGERVIFGEQPIPDGNAVVRVLRSITAEPHDLPYDFAAKDRKQRPEAIEALTTFLAALDSDATQYPHGTMPKDNEKNVASLEDFEEARRVLQEMRNTGPAGDLLVSDGALEYMQERIDDEKIW